MKQKNYNIREMLLVYQDFLAKQKEKDDNQEKIAVLEQEKQELERKKDYVQKEFDEARKRLQIAESNDLFQGMQTSVQNLENQIRVLEIQLHQDEEQVAKLLRLQKSFSVEFPWMMEKWEEERKTAFLHIADAGYSVDKKERD